MAFEIVEGVESSSGTVTAFSPNSRTELSITDENSIELQTTAAYA